MVRRQDRVSRRFNATGVEGVDLATSAQPGLSVGETPPRRHHISFSITGGIKADLDSLVAALKNIGASDIKVR